MKKLLMRTMLIAGILLFINSSSIGSVVSGQTVYAAKKSNTKIVDTFAVSDEEKAACAAICRAYYQDEITATLVDLGAIQKVGKVNTSADGVFTIDFKAISGDDQNPMLFFDIIVSDPNFVNTVNEFELSTYTLGVDTFYNEFNRYCTCEGNAYKDGLVANVYHCMFRGAPAWLCYDREAIVFADHLTLNDGTKMPVKIEFRLTPSRDKFYKGTRIYDPNFTLSSEGFDFKATDFRFSLYESCLGFYFDDIYVHCDNRQGYDCTNVSETLFTAWENIRKTSALLVDGTPVYFSPTSWGIYGFVDSSKGYAYVFTPGINYDYAKEVLLVTSDRVIKLK